MRKTTAIWEKLQERLPPVEEEAAERARKQWLEQRWEANTATPEEEAAMAMQHIFRSEEVLDGKATAPARRKLWVWASSIAALLAVGFALWVQMGAQQAYPALLAMATPQQEEVMWLGSTYTMAADVCAVASLINTAPTHTGVAVPEGMAIVSQVGTAGDVGFYQVKAGGCTFDVLTEAPLPNVGEQVSFNAIIVKTTHFGREVAVLVEKVRHEVFE